MYCVENTGELVEHYIELYKDFQRIVREDKVIAMDKGEMLRQLAVIIGILKTILYQYNLETNYWEEKYKEELVWKG